MSEHHRDRRHHSGPAWPTGGDPDAARWPRGEEPQAQERTGFWSPLWEEDDDEPEPRPARPGGNGAGRTRYVSPPPQSAQPGGTHRPPPRPATPGPNSPTVRLPGGPRGAGAGVPRGPRDNSEQPTERLPSAAELAARREPDLLTHRDPDYDEDADLLEDQDSPLSDEERKKRRKKIWRRVRRTMYVLLVLMIVGPVLAFFIAYQLVTVPNANDVAAGQERNVVLQYADGSELTKLVPEDGSRTMVTYQQLQEAPQVLNAVFAAEDATFMSNAGFDITGVMRAGWNQVTGGEGGGSTITQQYIKKATGEDEQTLTRKAIEVVKAYKMNRTYSKEDIITAYLNTIYFGRNAYGIAAASKAYYGVEFKALTPSQAALLAGMIQSPSRFKDNEYMQRRWNYVMDQLVANNWFGAEQRKAEQFPAPVAYETTRNKGLSGPRGLILEVALDEVEQRMGITREEIQRRGYTIVTTIDPRAQNLAEQAVGEGMKGLPDNLRPALVAVDPANGEVKAYYGGAQGVLDNDWAATKQEPGSSFKPFDLVAYLKTGKGLGEMFDSANIRLATGKVVSNSSKPSCAQCSVAQAMKESLNTVFYSMVTDSLKPGGPGKVAEAAAQAGVTAPLDDATQDANISIGGGRTQVSTLDMASAYATFAAKGVHHDAHIVSKVLNSDGSPYWTPQGSEKLAFDNDRRTNEKIARNVTEALLPIPAHSKIACADGRLCAGKTGTHQRGDTGENAKAWMVGYTPQVSTAVSLSAINGEAINDARGGDIFGAKVPGAIWKKFMDSYHKTLNLPKADFGRFDPIGKDAESVTSTSKKPSNPQQPTTTTEQRREEEDEDEPDERPTTTTTTTTRRPPVGIPTFSDPPGPGDGG